MPANLEGGLALFVSALQGSLAAGSAVGGLVYDAKGPSGALWTAAAVTTAGSLTLLSRAGKRRRKARSTERESERSEHPEVSVRGQSEAATRKEPPYPTRL